MCVNSESIMMLTCIKFSPLMWQCAINNQKTLFIYLWSLFKISIFRFVVGAAFKKIVAYVHKYAIVAESSFGFLLCRWKINLYLSIWGITGWILWLMRLLLQIGFSLMASVEIFENIFWVSVIFLSQNGYFCWNYLSQYKILCNFLVN